MAVHEANDGGGWLARVELAEDVTHVFRVTPLTTRHHPEDSRLLNVARTQLRRVPTERVGRHY